MDKFAFDFKPTFSASQLSNFIGNPGVKTKVNFLVRFEPFTEYSQQVNKSKKKLNPILVTDDQKALILNDLKTNVSRGEFNDESLIEKARQIKSELNSDQLSEKLDEMKLCKSVDETDEISESDEENMQKIRQAQINRYVSTNRGKIFESHILERINEEDNFSFIKNKETKYFDFGNFRISGIIDGIDYSGEQIIEIKTRNKLDSEKSTITNRERIQVLAYLKLFDCERCLFVECGPDGKMKKEFIEWNESEFETVVKKLERFTMLSRELKRNEFAKMIESLL